MYGLPLEWPCCDMGREVISFLWKLGTEQGFLFPRHLQIVPYQKPAVPSHPPKKYYVESIITA